VHIAVTVLTRKQGKLNLEELTALAYKEVEARIDKAVGHIGRLAFEYGRKTK